MLLLQLTDITQLSFHAGHVISEKNGGEINVNNLRPICQNCNSSMGTTNMNDYIEKYKLHE
jgi:5-methylcytosine-specific restriction endonuclease McrA